MRFFFWFGERLRKPIDSKNKGKFSSPATGSSDDLMKFFKALYLLLICGILIKSYLNSNWSTFGRRKVEDFNDAEMIVLILFAAAIFDRLNHPQNFYARHFRFFSLKRNFFFWSLENASKKEGRKRWKGSSGGRGRG